MGIVAAIVLPLIIMGFGLAILFNVCGFRDLLIRRSGQPRFGSARNVYLVTGALFVAIPLYMLFLVISDSLSR